MKLGGLLVELPTLFHGVAWRGFYTACCKSISPPAVHQSKPLVVAKNVAQPLLPRPGVADRAVLVHDPASMNRQNSALAFGRLTWPLKGRPKAVDFVAIFRGPPPYGRRPSRLGLGKPT